MANLLNQDHAVSFAEALAEELVEVDALRQKRKVEGHLDSRSDRTWENVEQIAKKARSTGRKDKEGKDAADQATLVVGQARQMELAGLAFSGGGIRSATFNLGVLQGLAKFNKVRTFDYLSTVSGGGYIGNWLGAWIKRPRPEDEKLPAGEAARDGIDVVEEELRPTRTERLESVKKRESQDAKSHTEPPPIRFLREYSNYLTPRLGALGADTWTVITIYFRNLLLIQTILILFLFALLLIPYIAVWLTHALPVELMGAAPFVVFALMTWALSAGARNLRGLTDPKHKTKRTREWLPPQEERWVLLTIIAPFSIALWVLTAWLWPNAVKWDAMPAYWWPLGGMVLFGLPLVIGSLLAPHQQAVNDESHKLLREVLAWLRRYKLGWLHNPKMGWVLASLATGAVSGLLMKVVVHHAFVPMSAWCGADWHELSLGVPLTLLVFLVATALHVGFMGRTFYDPYREWWSRVVAWILILAIIWAAGFGIAIYASLGLLWLRGWLKVGGLAWIGSTAAGVLGGKSDKTGNVETGGIKVKLLSITPYIFIVGLLSLLSLSLELILATFYMAHTKMADAHTKMVETWNVFLAESPTVEKVANWVLKVSGNGASGAVTLSGAASTSSASAPHGVPPYLFAHFKILSIVTSVWLIPACVVVLLVCLWLSYRVDLNEFSMNLMYRNRLVRCYLGATHERRQPNPFSGLDSGDDLFLSALRSSEGYSGPLPILNGTLNLVSTRDLAWQERKAESFPMTPLRCGFDTWIEQRNLEKNYASDRKLRKADDITKFAYRPTEKYGYIDKGLYVGTAMSISGAAASPNMGYHSVPSLALLMTFFNVRLGFWAGNPRNSKTWTHPGPKVGLGQLLRELFGLTNDNARYVYLSDGGHFENLGVYELVKRRCKYIVACDAGADPNYAFDDLGNAIRKCREDIGVEIEVDTAPLIPKSDGANGDKSGKKQTTQHCVVGTIHYDMADPEGGKGVFVYIKASLTGDEPADVLNYQTCHATFPHQSTADQWFSESQFESYRRLGQHIVETLFAGRESKARDGQLISVSASDRLRGLSTTKLFKELQKKWPGDAPKRNRKPASPKP
jgi:hypothetical protein